MVQQRDRLRGLRGHASGLRVGCCKPSTEERLSRPSRSGSVRCGRLRAPEPPSLRHPAPRSTPVGSPTTHLAAAARSRARTRRMWRRRSMTTTARRARRAPKRVALGGAAARPASSPPRPHGVSTLVALGCATHAGAGPAEPGEGLPRGHQRLGRTEAAESCGLREQASARPHLSSPQLGRRVEAARLLLEGLRGQLVVSRCLILFVVDCCGDASRKVRCARSGRELFESECNPSRRVRGAGGRRSRRGGA